jgi:molybdopterin-guanine dinucleotide biosynthesis protein A
MKRGGIVLCGGKSSRMGLPKATLPFGPELMLQRVVRLLGVAVDYIVIVAAPGQDIPALPKDVEIARDRREGRGPLEGLAAGLAAIQSNADVVFATSCDVPLLEPAFVERLFSLLGEHDVAVPREEKFFHPLAAVYRVQVLPYIERLIEEDRMRPYFLFQSVPTREVTPDEWADVDMKSHSLMNLNRPEDYLAALEVAGFAAAEDFVRKLQDGIHHGDTESTETDS